jgi:hypothetical protein
MGASISRKKLFLLQRGAGEKTMGVMPRCRKDIVFATPTIRDSQLSIGILLLFFSSFFASRRRLSRPAWL